MKKIIFLVAGLILIIFTVRFMVGGDEDTWICQDGSWVKHGNLSSSMPTEVCK